VPAPPIDPPEVRVPDPPNPFPSGDINSHILKAGTPLHRIYRKDLEWKDFNPCLGDPTRFAPLRKSDGKCIPTAYAATEFEAAAHETIFHEVDPSISAQYVVAIDKINDRKYSEIYPKRDLRLAGLFQADLLRLGLQRLNLIDTMATCYRRTALWAIATHEAEPNIDGMIWTSRRCDPQLALVLFGDRVKSTDLAEISSAPLNKVDSPSLFGQIVQFAQRSNIRITT
jgi:hypothetical protein